jgi:hypothetical protein
MEFVMRPRQILLENSWTKAEEKKEDKKAFKNGSNK